MLHKCVEYFSTVATNNITNLNTLGSPTQSPTDQPVENPTLNPTHPEPDIDSVRLVGGTDLCGTVQSALRLWCAAE